MEVEAELYEQLRFIKIQLRQGKGNKVKHSRYRPGQAIGVPEG
jgi:hypothetical protein